jgi:hypothetical protein
MVVCFTIKGSVDISKNDPHVRHVYSVLYCVNMSR